VVVSRGSASVSCFCGLVHLEIAGGRAVDRLGNAGMAFGQLPGQERFAENDWMVRRQSVASDAAGSNLLWCKFCDDFRGGCVSGDAAAVRASRDRAAADRKLPGILRTATGGVEFAGDESFADSVWRKKRHRCGSCGIVVWSAALAEPGPGAGHGGGRHRHGVAIWKRTEHCAVGRRASGTGVVDLVGVSASLASFDASGAGVLELCAEVKR
jgi:hypothetical protein